MPYASSTSDKLAVSALTDALHGEADALAKRLGLPLLESDTEAKFCTRFRALLQVSEGGLALQLTGAGAPGPVGVDFASPGMRHRRASGHNELLGRAVGIGKKHPLTVLDATAGLGRDAYVLADLGAEVLLSERNPVIAALLESGIQRAAECGEAHLRDVVSRMKLVIGESCAVTAEDLAAVDVIYLDPMFPKREKQAAVKKEMALFQLLLGAGDDSADELLDWALQQAVARVVVKRPRKAPLLAGRKPSHQLSGKSVRFDVYTLGAFRQCPENTDAGLEQGTHHEE